MALTKDSMQYYDAYEAYGTVFLTSSQLDSGIYIKNKVLSFLYKQPDSKQKDKLLSSAYNGLGNIYSLTGKPDSALIYFKQALNYRIKGKDRIDIQINIADQYKQKGDYATAAFYLRDALSACDSLHLIDLQFPIHFALGDIYLSLKDYKTSDFHYSLAEQQFSYRKIMEKIVFSNNRGNYYYYLKNYQKAKDWFYKEKKIAITSKNTYFLNLSYLNLSDANLNIGELDSCSFYIKKAQAYFLSIRFGAALYYINTIKIGLAIKQHNYVLAARLEKLFGNEEEISPNIISIRNRYLEALFIKQDNYKKAYQYLKANMLLNDSIRSNITQKRIEELDMRYKQDTILKGKELLIQRREAEVKSLKTGTYIWILISALGLILSIFIYFIIKKKHSMQRMEYINQVTKLRMTNIRNRISPHFMFNVLNNGINGLDSESENKLHTLIHLLRKSLDMTEQTSIKLSDEIEFAKAYIEIEKYKLGGNFKMIWNIAADIDINEIKIFPMMLQIPIENALKHGLRNIEKEKRLTVDILNEKDGIVIIISDNGKGYYPKKANNSSGTGTGLKVLRQTIQILNSCNKHKITFSITNKESEKETGANTQIFIPYQFNFEHYERKIYNRYH